MAKESNVLSTLEQERLEQSYNFRKRMVDEAFKESVPTSARDMEVINGILNSMDKAVYDNVNVRLKQQDIMNKEATLEIVAEALRKVHNAKQSNVQPDRQVELEDKLIPTDIVEGEMDIVPVSVTLNDILDEKE